MFAAFLSSILFSISVACGYRSSKLIGGSEANLWRLVVAGLCLGVWAYGRGIGLSGPAFPLFLLSGIVGIGVGDYALFQALPRLGSRLCALMNQCLAAPIAALIEWFWLGSTLRPTQIFSGLVILTGVAIALAPGANLHLSRKAKIVGTTFAIFAALGNSFGVVLSRKAYAVTHAAGVPIDGGTAAFQRILGGLAIAAFMVLILKRQVFKIQANAPPELVIEASRKKWRAAWPWVLVNGLAGQTLGVSCMQWALESTESGIVLAIVSITPITIIPVAYVLEKEKPTLHSVVGGIIAVAGVIALTLSSHKH